MISLAKSQRAQRVELSEKEYNGIAGDTVEAGGIPALTLQA